MTMYMVGIDLEPPQWEPQWGFRLGEHVVVVCSEALARACCAGKPEATLLHRMVPPWTEVPK